MQLSLPPELLSARPCPQCVASANITFIIPCKVLGNILGVLVGITIPRAYAIGLRKPNGTATEACGHVLSM